ncbi:MAG: DUF3570 domain-containing protein [Verrucomicrobia bacterium]|mgnify:CR=1 FL=1|jgi:hypothetical protein|nr:DUF3570 domain-containing protein [Verrucomicrobiota bacterium]MBT7066865.1 DUF3570 domain-containing protein [Verrucomicrobiota bacterium]MBT7701598.1 DUF3570 domain-containing protein [Verrucomicrobiota bacterium]
MLLGTPRTITLALLSLLVVAAPVAFAGEGDAGTGHLEFGLGFYSNSDGSNGEEGNPFLDEESTIIEPVIVFDYNISDETAVWATFSYDYVSCASIDRLGNFPEQSGASGDNYLSIEGGLRRTPDRENAWGVFGHLSAEYDYFSIGLGGDYTRTAPDGNSSIKYALNGFFDSIDLIRFNGVEEGSDSRITLTAQVNAYQVMDPVMHAEYGGVLTVQSGYLATPYNAVVIEDTLVPNTNLVNMAPGREVIEELEDSLIRGAVFGRVRRSLAARHAVELGGRLYADSWGLTGISIEPRWYHWLIDGRLRLRLRYRFYTQSEADAFSETFLVEEEFRTQDADMGSFTAHTLGGLLTLVSGESSEIDLAADYITREDGIDQVLARLAYRWDF